jgi:WD40 repeat protein
MRHENKVNAVAFSPDGTRLATASEDNTARLWDTKTAAAVAPPMRHDAWVYSVAFSADGTRLATACSDKTVRLWDAVTAAPLAKPMEHDNQVWSVVFSPDGTRLVSGGSDNTARLWDVESMACPPGDAILTLAELFTGIRVDRQTGDVTPIAAEEQARLRTEFEQKFPEYHEAEERLRQKRLSRATQQ